MAYSGGLRAWLRSVVPQVPRVGAVLWRIGDRLFDALPADCLLCRGRATAGGLCAPCHAAVTASTRDGRRRCPTCALPLEGLVGCPDCAAVAPAFDRVIAAFDYTFPGDLLIHYLKDEKRFACARVLSALLARRVRADAVGLPCHTILVPVPSSRASVRRRGFNPAAEVARALARRLGLACRPALLRRVREGERQASLSRAARIANAQDLYVCGARADGCDITIVDDVMTTGSTAHVIARAFKSAGAASVRVAVLARTRHHLSSS